MTKQAQQLVSGPKPVQKITPIKDNDTVRRGKSARDIRRERARRVVIRLAIWVGLPTLIATVYYGFWAAPQYESVAVFSIQSERGAASLEGLAAILPATGSTRDAMIVREYINSRDMLDILIRDHEFVQHYENSGDWVSRLAGDASSEEIYDYYLDRVDVTHSSQSGSLTLRVRAYSADRAQEFARAITDAAEHMVNEISDRARDDRIKVAEQEVVAVQERLQKARETLLRLQGEGADINPTQSAEALLTVRGELEADLARAQADLDALQAVMRSDAPKVKELRARVRSLRAQIEAQNKRLVASDGGSINESIARFEPAMIEKEFAEQAYAASLKSLELARVDSMRQKRYLVMISQPSRPSAATHPRRLWSIATVFAISFGLMIVLTMLGAAIREHAKF